MARRKPHEFNTFEYQYAHWHERFGVLPITPEQHKHLEREQRAYTREFNQVARKMRAAVTTPK